MRDQEEVAKPPLNAPEGVVVAKDFSTSTTPSAPARKLRGFS